MKPSAGSISFLFTGLESTGAMPKFYVQSGSFRGIVERENADLAARWAVETVMRSPSTCIPETCSCNRSLSSTCTLKNADNLPSNTASMDDNRVGLFRLANAIGVSERGFNRKNRRRIPTSDAVLLWMLHRRSAEQRVSGEAPAS